MPDQDPAVLLDGFSVEMTGRDVPELEAAAALLPVGTEVSVTSLGNESHAMRVSAARAVHDLGLVPVPHLCARRLSSSQELEEVLDALATEASAQHLLVVGGDPSTPHGPYEDAMAVIRSGLLGRFGFEHVSIAGYPEGHPRIGTDRLWSSLTDKIATVTGLGLRCSVVTQFGFSTEPVLAWLVELRRRGLEVPVRIGVPGPAGTRRLMTLARRFGVASSAGVVRKYGLSLTNLMRTTGPDRFLAALDQALQEPAHGPVRLHFYTFGGLAQTARWVRAYGHRPG